MSNVLVPIIAGQLENPYCFTGWQKALVDFSNAMQVVLDGATYYNYGPTRPAAQYEGYPWLKSTDGRWYMFSGAWLAPMNHDTNERRIYVGTTGNLVTYDGGDSGAPSDRSGPAWEVDTQFEGRVPIGVGLIPGSTTPAVTTGVEDAVGAAEHTLSEAEGSVGQHVHGFGKYLGGAAGLSNPGSQTVPSYNGAVVQGIAGASTAADTTANLFTLPSGNAAAGVTPTPFSVVQPAVAVYVIKPTGRLFYVG